MPNSPMNCVVEHLRRAVLRDGARLDDGELLDCFIEHHDEAALAALVERHGPMVWGACRRLLSHHDAEDAFQATFLVFVRKATSIVPREMVGNWLYGVAHQTALQARRTAARRRAREVQVTVMPDTDAVQQDHWLDLQPLLDQELSRLPDNYRAVIVLCDMESLTRKVVARQLRVPEGTVAGRLARARKMLAKRLTDRGVTLTGGALAAVLSQKVASAGMPTSLMTSTIKTARLYAAGQASATAVISAKVAALTEGVLKAMYLTKLKVVMVMGLLLFAALVGGGVSVGGPSNQAAIQGASKPNLTQESSPPKATEQPPASVAPGLLDLQNARMVSAQAPKNKIPEGTWLLAAAENELDNNRPLAIIKTENGDGGKVNAKVVSTVLRDDLKISNVTVEGNLLKMVLRSSRGDWHLEAILPVKDDKKMYGSLNIYSQIFPLTLTPTDKTELKREAGGVVKFDVPPQVLEIHQFHHKARELRGQFNLQKEADKAAELLNKAKEAEKDAAEKAPKLLDELLEKDADPIVIYTALNVLKIMGKVKYDQQQIQRIVGLAEKAVQPYGPAMNKELKLQIATILTEIDGAAPYALEFILGLEKDLKEEDATAQIRVLNPLMTALKKAGKIDEAKSVAARIEKLDQILDKEYIAKVPPFKPERYEGRTTMSKRVAVMELFTGTQCGPCVAADVAFEALGKTYKPNELALIQYHMHIPGPDPLANAETQERWDYYAKAYPDKVVGTPTTLFNGKPEAGGGGGMPKSKDKYDEYRKIIDPLLDTMQEVQLSATASRKGNKIEIQAEVNGLKNADENMKLRFLLVEESIRYLGANNLRFHYHVVRTFPGGVEGFALKEKDLKKTASVDLDKLRKKLTDHLDDYANIREFPNQDRPIDLKHLKVIALVQDDKTSEILQAIEIEVGGESEK